MNTEAPTLLTAKRAASLLKHRTLDLYYLRGLFDGEPLRILVADDGATLSYVKTLAFDEEPEIAKTGRIGAFAAPKLLGVDADLVFVGANCLLSKHYARRGFRLVPRWVRLFLPTTQEPYSRLYDFGRQTRKYFKWMLKKVSDEGFECEFISEPGWLRGFYDEFYRPYALSKFGEDAIIHGYQKLESAFRQGSGAEVRKDGKVLAGAIVSRRGQILRIPHFGVALDCLNAFRDGSAFALDYFIVQHAHSNGFGYVDFGHSRPFLSDGILRYKLNWHMDVLDDDDAIGVYAVAAPGNTPSAQKFLAANRFYELTPDGPRVIGDSEQEEG